MATPSPLTTRSRRLVARLVLVLAAVVGLARAHGQLAITEVMSAPAAGPGQRTDFWELTNFGTNTIDLTSFYFRDEGGFSTATRLGDLADPLQIAPGESIVFVQTNTITGTPADFRQWWGETN